MKILPILFGIGLAVVLFTSLPTIYSSPVNPANQKLINEKTIDGKLLNVDTRARLISLRGPDQKEVIFNYDDDTQVISPERTIQGLTGKPGSDLRISYREDRGIKLATRIELIEKQ